MANQEHLDILKQGVEVWNRWRKEHPGIRPDLSDADLSEVELMGVDLKNANLSSANLNRANLIRAELFQADLSGANLSETDLRQALLIGTNLSNAKLIWADLEGATLSGTSLRGTDLSGTDLHEIYDLDKEEFIAVDLSDVKLGGADLSKKDLHGAQLSGADLMEANLFDTNLKGSDLSYANLFASNLGEARLSEADLRQANLGEVDLRWADLSGADLTKADLTDAYLYRANLNRAILSEANLSGAYLFKADLSGADLREADLSGANLSEANLSGADLEGCRVYGISAWNVQLKKTLQRRLIVTRSDEPTVTVENLEIAQFIYLLLDHKKLRDILNVVTDRGVLILGRFGGGGLEVLQAIAERLKEEKYLPIIFDFERPQSRNYTETIKTLAGLSRFIIADLSGPSVPQELYATIPHFKIPFVPIIEAGRKPFSMAVDLLEYPWVVRPPVTFATTEELLELMPTRVIAPAEEKHQSRQKLLGELFNKT